MGIQTTTFDIALIQDSSLTNNIDGILNSITNEVQKGNTVVIEKQYSNAESDVIMQITTIEHLEMFKKQYLFH
jgi:hypothetical protein